MFYLYIIDAEAELHEIGSVKIGSVGLQRGRPKLATVFETVPEGYFSLGQDDEYYSNLNELGDETRDAVLVSLRDLAQSPSLFKQVQGEAVTKTALLRSVPPSLVTGQYNRLTRGGARLSKYSFSYTLPSRSKGLKDSPILTFEVEPESEPPTNIHVLIGRNGVGKTQILGNMQQALVVGGRSASVGKFHMDSDAAVTFANIVSVSFSAFDDLAPLGDSKATTEPLYTYIGLQRPGAGAEPTERGSPKSPAELATDFVDSMLICRLGTRLSRWLQALKTLEADPIFSAADLRSLASSDLSKSEAKRLAASTYARLSSGHKIVLLTITRLVETVEEKTLVFLDEPEAHLHPPLLSAFVRTLSDLLTNRNGVGIIATHSPVILQEVPRSCVWKIRRSGAVMRADRPEAETFAENVGVLTREIFGLEVTQSGFHRLLFDAVDDEATFDAVVERFGGQLGGEGLALVRARMAALRSDPRTGR